VGWFVFAPFVGSRRGRGRAHTALQRVFVFAI
jgi:hypothetical protein